MMFEKVKGYYDRGLWDMERVRHMVLKGVVTADEFEDITGVAMTNWGGYNEGVMVGSTETADGKKGFVPAPEKGSPKRFLNAGGIWTPANGGNADTIDGFHAAQTPNAKNTCIVRDGNGYAQLNYIASNTANNEDPGISQFITTNGNDNYFRKASLSHVKNSMGIGAINNGRVFSTRIRPYVAYPGYVDFLQITSQRIPDYKYTADSYPRIRAYFFILYDYTVLVSCSLWLNGSARSFKYNAESNDHTFNMYAANTGGDRYDLYLSTAGGHPNTARTIDIFGIVQIGAYEIKNTTVTSLPTGNFSLTDSSSLL